MAELSEQTEAILERLKAEGQLTRNTGTNSLKSVKVDLAKFTDVLSSVNSNIAEQTSIMRQTLDYNVQEAQRARDEARQEQLGEVAKKAEEKEKETQQKTEQEKKSRSNDATSIGGVLTNMLGGFKNFVIKSLLGAVGGIAIFELARGFFDERTGGEFSRFFDEIDWATMTTNMTSIASSISTGAQNFVNFIADPLGVILSSIGPVGAGAAVVTAAGLGGLLNSTDGDSEGVTKRRSKLRNFVKLSALGLVLAGTSAAASSIGNWVDKQEWSDDEIGSTTKGDLVKAGVDIGNAAIIGGSIGMMFGPGGALVGAVLGATVTLGFKAYEWWNDRKKKNEEQMALELAAAEALYAENAEDFDKLINDMATKGRAERDRIYNSLSEEAQGAVDVAIARNEEAMLRAQVTDMKNLYDNLALGGSMTASATLDAERRLQAAQQELDNYILQKSGRAQFDVAPQAPMSDEEYFAFYKSLGGGRGDGGMATYMQDRENYFGRLEALSNEAMLERARALGEAELMAGYINYGTQDQVGLSDYAQGFRREGGVTFRIKTSYGDVTPKDVEEGLGFFGTIGKFFGFGGEDVSSGGRNDGRPIIYKEGDTNISAPQVTGGTNLAIQSNIGGGTAPAGSEFPGYGN